MRNPRLSVVLVGLILLAGAGQAEDQPAKAVDDVSLLAVGGFAAARWFSDDPVHSETGKRMGDAVVVSALAATLLQETITSHRPNGQGDDGFPSRHATVAFAAAAALTEREPRLKWVAYPVAAAIGWAREDLDKHTWPQVLGGAALGVLIGHLAGEGKLHLFGHKDSALPAAGVQSTALSGGPRLAIWSTRF